MKKDELQRKVEEVKQDADVQRALKQATTVPEKPEGPVARMRDKLVIGTHLLLLLASRRGPSVSELSLSSFLRNLSGSPEA